MIVSSPQVHIVGGTEVKELPLAKVPTHKEIPSPSNSAGHEVGSSKCRRIIPMPIPIASSNSSSSASNLPSIIVPKLVVPAYALSEQINCPGGHKDYKCHLCVFQHTNRDCM